MNEQDFVKLQTKTIFFRCAIPGLLAMIVSSIYVMIDGMFVGKLIGSHALAAVNLGFPIIMILFAVGDMVAVGSAVKIALALGEKDNLTANRIFSAAFYMILGMGVLFMVIGFAIAPMLIKHLIKDTVLAQTAWEYIHIFLYFMPLIMPLFAVDNYLRICGKAKFSMYMNISIAILNIILDFIFLFVLRLDIRFAALATALSMVVGVGIAVLPFIRKKLTLQFTTPKIPLATIGGIFYNDSSEFFNNVSGSIMATVVNGFLLHLGGGIAVASYGIVIYIDTLLLMALYGIMDALQPPVSYNIGAGNHKKTHEFFRMSCIVTGTISFVFLIVMLVFPETIAKLFLEENTNDVLEMTKTALRLYAPAYLFLWLNMVISSFLTAMDKAKESLIIMLFRSLAFPAMCLLLLPNFLGVNGIFVTPSVSAALTCIIACVMWKKASKVL